MKDVHYCLAFAHDPGTFHFSRKKIVVPADVSGLKSVPECRDRKLDARTRRRQRAGLGA